MTTSSDPIVDAYAAAINAADLDAVVSLFDEHAMLLHPAGTFKGRDEISGFYGDVVLAGQAQIAIGDVLSAGGVVMAEIVAMSPLDPNADRVHAIDVFRLNASGRILGLEIYYR